MNNTSPISNFIEKHFCHFNAATLVDAAKSYRHALDNNEKMFVSIAGAMSTAEIGKSLAEMIRQGKVHAICCTGANLEEDMFNLVAHDYYERIPNYRDLTAEQEVELLEKGMNRVTDTCIPETEAMRRVEGHVIEEWIKADNNNESHPPHYYLYRLIENGALESHYQIDPRDSWLIAACQHNIPIFTPGWEDSTLGNMMAASCIKDVVSTPHIIESGIETMMRLTQWYQATTKDSSVGFFQIGGGIAGDFPICVVPLIAQDLVEETKLWSYFCQISDSTTSYGSYSGAVPNEKITWGKLDVNTPKFIIESDATIVAPLMFAYILGW